MPFYKACQELEPLLDPDPDLWLAAQSYMCDTYGLDRAVIGEGLKPGCPHDWETRWRHHILDNLRTKDPVNNQTLKMYWPKAMEAVKDMREYPGVYANSVTPADREMYGASAPLVMTPSKFLIFWRRLCAGDVQRLNYSHTKKARTTGGNTGAAAEVAGEQ